MPEDATSQIVLNFLDRVLDENMKCAEALVALRCSVDEERAELAKMSNDIQFNLRVELKTLITSENVKTREAVKKILEKLEEHEKFRKEDEERLQNVDQIISEFKKKGNFIRYMAIIAASLATFGGTLYAIVKSVASSDNSSTVQPQNKQPKK